MELTKTQSEIYNICKLSNKTRNIAVCSGRQIGKTTLAIKTSLDWCLTNPNYNVGLFLFTNKECLRIVNMFKNVFNISYDSIICNSVTYGFIIYFTNGSTIHIIDTSEKDFNILELDILELDSIILDELATMEDSIWYDRIETIKIKHKCLIMSTPRNKKWFYNCITKDFKKENSIVFNITTKEGGLVLDEIIESMEKLDLYRNQYLGEFID